MDDPDHRELIGALLELDGMVVLSAGRGTANRTECIWLNPACMQQVSQIGLDLGEQV